MKNTKRTNVQNIYVDGALAMSTNQETGDIGIGTPVTPPTTKEVIVVMRVYGRDAKRLRAKYPQFKNDAMRLEALLKPEIWFSNKTPEAKLEITSNANPYYGGDALLKVKNGT